MSVLVVVDFVAVAFDLDPTIALTWGYGLTLLDNVILGVYTFETMAKIFAWRRAFFDTNWRRFGERVRTHSAAEFLMVLKGWFIVLAIFLIPNMTDTALRMLKMLRSFRILRILKLLRTVSVIQSLQTILQTLSLSFPAMTTILLLTLYILYFYTVMCVFLFNSIDPSNFGNLAYSARAFLQVASLDVWSSIYIQNKSVAPAMFPVLVSYIVVQTFVLFK
ncbi:hypothetical protein HDU91_000365 [Kappamyces sp. JEL0680]|nr:hypothetical protein HDU91_000365 [Kappamyces sp. JEL0680]